MREEILKLIPDKLYLKMLYQLKIGKTLHLENPVSFNEKIQWLKIYDRNPAYSSLADKYEVRNYIKETVGGNVLIPLLGIWDKWEEIDFEILPNQFVLKCTHDSGGIVICREKEKLNLLKAKEKIKNALSRNYFYYWREYPYKNIKPRIMAEKYMEDDHGAELTDYKVMCFNGKAKCIFTCTERFTDTGVKVTFFDKDWKRLPFERHYPSSNAKINRPRNLDKMIRYAEALSETIAFLRVDFYEVENRVYIGELTFYPGSGFEEFTPDEYDTILGNWLKLPEKRK